MTDTTRSPNWEAFGSLLRRGDEAKVTRDTLSDIVPVTRPVLAEVLATLAAELGAEPSACEVIRNRLRGSNLLQDGRLKKVYGKFQIRLADGPSFAHWVGKETNPTKHRAYSVMDEVFIAFFVRERDVAFPIKLWVSAAYPNEEGKPSLLRIAIGGDNTRATNAREGLNVELQEVLMPVAAVAGKTRIGEWVVRDRSFLQGIRTQLECSLGPDQIEVLSKDPAAALKGLRASVFQPALGALVQVGRGLPAAEHSQSQQDPPHERQLRDFNGFSPLIHSLALFRNLVLEGAPGTGKTHTFKDLQENGVRPGRTCEITTMTFHPSTSYEEFVEGLRPPRSRAVFSEDDYWDVLGSIRQSGKGDAAAGEGAIRFLFGKKNGKGEELRMAVRTETETGPAGRYWNMADGFFVRAVNRALALPEKDFVVFLDELNRANVPKVLGDLLTTLEADRRVLWDGENKRWALQGKVNGREQAANAIPVELPGSGRPFIVPENLFVVATMNTTDRSIAPLDAALRRRFKFIRLEPMDKAALKLEFDRLDKEEGRRAMPSCLGSSLELWASVNTILQEKVGPDGLLGHSYMFGLRNLLKAARPKGGEEATDGVSAEEICRQVWRYDILPQVIDNVVSAGKDVELIAEHRKEKPEEPLSRLLAEEGTWLKLTVVRRGEGLLARAVVVESQRTGLAGNKEAGKSHPAPGSEGAGSVVQGPPAATTKVQGE
jgi:MoxR-like ATPase